MINVLVVDDHALVRMGICSLLEDVKHIHVVAEAEDGEQALQLAKSMSDLHVILLDMKLPGIDGLEVTRRLKRSCPELKIIAVTAFVNEPFPSRILQAGASGYLTKECGLDEMTEAITRVANGDRYLSAEVARTMALNSLMPEDSSQNPMEMLSERELQVTLMICQGMTVQAISSHLCISTKTVNGYRYRIFSKLDIKNDVELVHLAIKYNLIDRPVLMSEEV